MDHIPSPDRPEAAKTRAGDTRDNPGPRLHTLWVPRGTAFSEAGLSDPSGSKDARQRQQRQQPASPRLG